MSTVDCTIHTRNFDFWRSLNPILKCLRSTKLEGSHCIESGIIMIVDLSACYISRHQYRFESTEYNPVDSARSILAVSILSSGKEPICLNKKQSRVLAFEMVHWPLQRSSSKCAVFKIMCVILINFIFFFFFIEKNKFLDNIYLTNTYCNNI